MMQALKGVRHLHSSTVKQAVSELCVPVPWGEIRGKVWGPDHGRPVLCVHGWADNCGTFNNLIPLLPKECRYVAVDLAGHGLSSHRPPGVFYTFPSYVMDVRRVVDALQWNKFSIIGHSMGGNIAGLFSALYPEMVDAVVLLDSYGFLPTDLKEIPKVVRQGFEELLLYEKKPEEKKTRVYTYENAVERLSAANPTLSEQSVHILLERGLVQVEGGVVFSRDFRINLKNIVRISLEQSLELQSRIKASVLVVLAEDGFEKMFSEPDQKRFTSALLQGYRDRNHEVLTVPGDHHIHLNKPDVVAQPVSDFLLTKVLSESTSQTDEQASKL
ncbi:serine hydrolase-like protein [Acanthopagrus schlegelii]